MAHFRSRRARGLHGSPGHSRGAASEHTSREESFLGKEIPHRQTEEETEILRAGL